MFKSILNPNLALLRQASIRFLCQSASPMVRSIEKELPSSDFLNKYVRKPSQKEEFARLVTEIQAFFEIIGSTSLPQLTDDIWNSLMLLKTCEQRTNYLLMLKKLNVEEKSATFVVDNKNESKEDRNLIFLQDATLRNRIETTYGSRFIRTATFQDELPKLLIDCRFLNEFSFATQEVFMNQIQKLHEFNSLSRNPFDITSINYTPDQQMSEIAKKQLLFRYGPTCLQNNFTPHLFSPTLTSRNLKSVLPCDKKDAIFISWKAKEVLPAEPISCKAVVFCTSLDTHPSTSSYSVAIQENIKAYRIPVEKHVLLEGQRRVLPLAQSASVLRSYFLGEDLGEAIRKSFTKRKGNKGRVQEEEALIEHYKAVIKDIRLEDARKAQQMKFLESGKPTSNKRPARIYKHRYSREERSKKREEKNEPDCPLIFPDSSSNFTERAGHWSLICFVIELKQKECMEFNGDRIDTNSTTLFFGIWTREQAVTYISFAYVVISILMVLVWSMYLCWDGRRTPKRDTRVIHMLAQGTMSQLQIP